MASQHAPGNAAIDAMQLSRDVRLASLLKHMEGLSRNILHLHVQSESLAEQMSQGFASRLESEVALENLTAQVSVLSDAISILRCSGDQRTGVSRAVVGMPPANEAPP